MKIARVLTVSLPALSLVLGGCQSLAPTAPADVFSMPSATGIPSAGATSRNPPQSAPTATLEFQRLSPASIMRVVQTEVTIEAYLFARETCLRLEVHVSGFQWGPAFPRESRLIKQVAFIDSLTGAPLAVEELLLGAGGGGGEGVPVTMEESLTYDVKSSLVPARVAALVTFHQALGISKPVRFELQPVARPNMYCPQLPPTTPEG